MGSRRFELRQRSEQYGEYTGFCMTVSPSNETFDFFVGDDAGSAVYTMSLGNARSLHIQLGREIDRLDAARDKSHPEQDLMSATDAGKTLGVTGERVRQMAEAGDLPVAGRTAGGRVYWRADVEALRDARKCKTRGGES